MRRTWRQATKDGEQLLLLARATVARLQREAKEGTFRKDKLEQQQQQLQQQGAPDPDVSFLPSIALDLSRGWEEK